MSEGAISVCPRTGRFCVDDASAIMALRSRVAALETEHASERSRWAKWRKQLGDLQRERDEARAQLAEARAVMRLLRHHRIVERDGIPHDLLEREAGLIGYIDEADARRFKEAAGDGDGKEPTER